MEFDMEMPTPCQHCGVIFDLNDGSTSELWFPKTIICYSCSCIEQSEIEIKNEIADYKNQIEDAEWTIKDSKFELEICEKRLLEIEKEKESTWRSLI